jgi:pyruvate/2-oxoglutarate dehydrogenase complex dihydrolipoamide dehydrogenase (E3) component
VSDKQAATARAAALTPDLGIIGAGPGGLALASAAAAFGVSVVLIERATMGGSRLELRKAALRAAAAQAFAQRHSGPFGLAAADAAVNYAGVHEHVRRASTALAANDSAERMGALGVTVLKGEARFASRSTVRVGEHEIKARRFVIATGSEPALPDLPGLATTPHLTPETLLDLSRRPERLLVLGTGAPAVELAQSMARLGSMVTLIANGEGLLPGEDPEAAGLVRRALLREGVTLLENAQVTSVGSAKGAIRLVLSTAAQEEQRVEGTHLLVATGRRAAIGALDLELAGVAASDRGVMVDRALRTRNRRVFAIGDCVDPGDGARLGPSAANQANLVLRNLLFRLPTRLQPSLLPRLVGCDPEIASVGLSEAEARAAHRPVTILRWPYAEIERAQAERQSEGFLKLVSDRKGRILGVTIVGARAGDLITPWCLAIQKGLSVQDMAALVAPSPSFSELSTRAANSFYAPLATKPGLRRLIGFLRRFG